MERLQAVVHGDVQGVGFRYFVQRKAHQLGLSGWVRNRLGIGGDDNHGQGRVLLMYVCQHREATDTGQH